MVLGGSALTQLVRLVPVLVKLVPELVKLVPGVKQGLARLNSSTHRGGSPPG